MVTAESSSRQTSLAQDGLIYQTHVLCAKEGWSARTPGRVTRRGKEQGRGPWQQQSRRVAQVSLTLGVVSSSLELIGCLTKRAVATGGLAHSQPTSDVKSRVAWRAGPVSDALNQTERQVEGEKYQLSELDESKTAAAWGLTDGVSQAVRSAGRCCASAETKVMHRLITAVHAVVVIGSPCAAAIRCTCMLSAFVQREREAR